MILLADFGSMLQAKKLKPETPIYLIQCRATAVIADEEGYAHITFCSYFETGSYMGSLIVEGDPEAVAIQLGEWGGMFHARAFLSPADTYCTPHTRETVVPLRGTLFGAVEEMMR